jgi:hypothetical protein
MWQDGRQNQCSDSKRSVPVLSSRFVKQKDGVELERLHRSLSVRTLMQAALPYWVTNLDKPGVVDACCSSDKDLFVALSLVFGHSQGSLRWFASAGQRLRWQSRAEQDCTTRRHARLSDKTSMLCDDAPKQQAMVDCGARPVGVMLVRLLGLYPRPPHVCQLAGFPWEIVRVHGHTKASVDADEHGFFPPSRNDCSRHALDC